MESLSEASFLISLRFVLNCKVDQCLILEMVASSPSNLSFQMFYSYTRQSALDEIWELYLAILPIYIPLVTSMTTNSHRVFFVSNCWSPPIYLSMGHKGCLCFLWDLLLDDRVSAESRRIYLALSWSFLLLPLLMYLVNEWGGSMCGPAIPKFQLVSSLKIWFFHWSEFQHYHQKWEQVHADYASGHTSHIPQRSREDSINHDSHAHTDLW